MISTRCSDCELVNWSGEESCKRCGAALTVSGAALQCTNEKSSGLPWMKLLLILMLVAIVAIPLSVWLRRVARDRELAARNRELATAIQSSPLFAKPVTVEAYGTRGIGDTPNDEAIILQEAGLLTIDYEPDSKPPSGGPYWPEPNATFIRTMRRTYLDRILSQPNFRLIPKDIAATRDWQTFEDRERRRRGWTVPVGTRELAELTAVEETDTATARVQFTWYWKPNEVGRHFDFNEQARQSNPRAKRKSNPRLASDFPFKGTAELSRTGNGWEVKTITWNLQMPVRVN